MFSSLPILSPDHRAGPLRKIDLRYSYASNAFMGDDTSKCGIPDSVLVNRNEWYEVLYFVNKFANNYGRGQASVAIKAEGLLRTVAPGTLRSHQHITEFLLQHWDRYQ